MTETSTHDQHDQHDEQDEATREVLAWFDHYDSLVAAGDVEGMADQAVFPLNEVTDDAEGHAVVGLCGRARFVTQMRGLVDSPDASQVRTESVRQPFFFSPALCFVVTDATITVGEDTHTMRYGDLLIKTSQGWRFQTMVAGGWAEQMTG